MYWNYLKTGFRNLLRNKLFSIINITGFSIGLAVFFLIVLWINYEVGFDRFHKNAKKIYRVVAEFERDGNSDNFANTPAPLGPALKEEFPEVLEYVRCIQTGKDFITCGDNQDWDNIFFADESIFKIFNFRLTTGNPSGILSSPDNVVISQRMVAKYFKGENPLGKTISVGFDSRHTYTIAGVLEDIPSNSQFQTDFLLPFNIISDNSGWGIWNFTTYVLLDKQNDYKNLQGKLQKFIEKYQPDSGTKLHLQPLVKIHLFSNLRSDLAENVHYSRLILYAAIAVIILLLATINFINLSLAKSTFRNKEIGIRKVTGANIKQIRTQFIGESFIVTLISFILAVPVIYFFLPVFNEITDKHIAFGEMLNNKSIAIVFVILLILTLVNGLYPASVFASYNPVGILRGNFSHKQNSIRLVRQTFIVFQFFVAIFFISGTLIIKSQLNFIKQKDLGFDKEHVVIIPIFYKETREKGDLLAGEIKKSASVKEVSFTSYLPSEQGYFQNVWWEGLQENQNEYFSWIAADEDFISLMGIKLLQGRYFDKNLKSDSDAYIINEKALKKTGWENPLGKLMNITGKGEVIGVVDNFNFRSLHNSIDPVAIKIYPDVYKYLYIKTLPKSVTSALSDIKTVWSGLFPDKAFKYTFLEDNLAEVYNKEAKESKAVNYISIFAILIASLGILGLSSLLVTNRIKEIGIRKVNGAKVADLLLALNTDFVKWVAIAFVIATPAAYYAMNRWLENFAYKTSLSWWIFALAGSLALGITLLTVSWQSWRAATRNPVEALRYE